MAMYFDENFDCNDERNRKMKRKVDELDNFDFDFIENLDELKLLAIQNYELINSRTRKRVWELLILNSNSIETRILYREISNNKMKKSLDFY